MHDRDATFDVAVVNSINAFGLTSVRTAPCSPWQNPYIERVIGSIRCECLDHVIIFNERHLRWVLRAYVVYYHRSRTHLALAKDTPEARAVDATGTGRIEARSEVGDSITGTNGKRPESVSRGRRTRLGVKVCLQAGPTASPGGVRWSTWPIAIPLAAEQHSFCALIVLDGRPKRLSRGSGERHSICGAQRRACFKFVARDRPRREDEQA